MSGRSNIDMHRTQYFYPNFKMFCMYITVFSACPADDMAVDIVNPISVQVASINPYVNHLGKLHIKTLLFIAKTDFQDLVCPCPLFVK